MDDTVIVNHDVFSSSSLEFNNGDGVNDMFEIVGLQAYPDNEIIIFNRLGASSIL
jgi:hypothetical protein